MARPEHVRLVEVGPRDGLQNQSASITAENRAAYIHKLAEAGLHHIEVGSFVSPRAIPQMQNTDQVLTLTADLDIRRSILVPNDKGMQRAVAFPQVNEVAIFAAASETFSQRNLNCSIDESFARFIPVIEMAKAQGIPVRGYLSCIFRCPWGDKTPVEKVAELTNRLLEMGCYEVSLGDTTGHGTPDETHSLMSALSREGDISKLAVHFHNTYGMALANLVSALDAGIAVIDSASGGLGGCPYAKGASGNVATEDVIWLLNSMGIHHGIDLPKVIEASRYIFDRIQSTSPSSVYQALQGQVE